MSGAQLAEYLTRRTYALASSTRPYGRAHAAPTLFTSYAEAFWLPTLGGAVRLGNVRANELLSQESHGAELLFQIITEHEERASIAIATNLPFSEWGTVFPAPPLVAAIVDRVTFNAHILETGTQSHRLRTSKTTTRRKRPA